MMKKTAVILACAAAFTVATAQVPWETESTFDASAGAQEDNSYDAGQGELGGEPGEPAVAEEAAADVSEEPAKPAKQKAAREKKPPREKREKPPREKREKTAKAEKADKAERGESSGLARIAVAPAAYGGPQKTCPVCASPRLKGKLYVAHDGRAIHVCCGTCIGRVKRDPAKYIKALEARGEQLAKR
jgi:hypothetical protein